jgi:D-tagatose-1,6-bisphosphate aldolase subunit GatZ/KbaZ
MPTTDVLSPVQQIIAAHRRGEAAGLYSVCCSHPSVLRAAMRVAAAYDTVLLVEATSNQVDQFGGYTGMTPPQFRWSGWCWAATISARTRGNRWMRLPPCTTPKR